MGAPYPVPSAGEKYGGALLGQSPATSVLTPLHALGGPSEGAAVPPWSPRHPLFWFGLVAAGAIGFMGVSTTGRVGPVRANIDLGKK